MSENYDNIDMRRNRYAILHDYADQMAWKRYIGNNNRITIRDLKYGQSVLVKVDLLNKKHYSVFVHNRKNILKEEHRAWKTLASDWYKSSMLFNDNREFKSRLKNRIEVSPAEFGRLMFTFYFSDDGLSDIMSTPWKKDLTMRFLSGEWQIMFNRVLIVDNNGVGWKIIDSEAFSPSIKDTQTHTSVRFKLADEVGASLKTVIIGKAELKGPKLNEFEQFKTISIRVGE